MLYGELYISQVPVPVVPICLPTDVGT